MGELSGNLSPLNWAPYGSIIVAQKERKVTVMRKSLTALFLATLTSGMMTAQDPGAYLDEFIVKVKPEKRAEFDAINKKMVALNRRNKGDAWLASENMYGENNVVTFVSR